MAKMIPFSEYKPARDGNVNLMQATDEVRREITVRKRLYDRWLAEGNITHSEGDSRLRGLMTALNYLQQHCNDEQAIDLPMASDNDPMA